MITFRHRVMANNLGVVGGSGFRCPSPSLMRHLVRCTFAATPATTLTSCRRAAATYAPAPLHPLWAPKRLEPPSWPRLQSADRNVAVGSHGQYVPTLTAAAAWRVSAAVSKAAWWPWPFDVESGVRVTCDVGYICANFGLLRLLCSQLKPDVRDRQTSDSIIA